MPEIASSAINQSAGFEYWKVDIEELKVQFAGLDYKFYIMDNLDMLCILRVRVGILNIAITAREV